MWSWLLAHGSDILGDLGIIAGLLFSGLGFWNDRRARRAQTVIDFTKSHRDLWSLVKARPAGATIEATSRDLVTVPRTDEETETVNLVVLHLHSAYRAGKAGIYDLPENLTEEIREYFSLPVVRDAWDELRKAHDRDFVRFIDRALNQRT